MEQKTEEPQGVRNTMFQRLKKKFSSDLGDAIVTTTVIAIPFFLLVGGFAIDTGKNNSVRTADNSMAQTAAQSAVRTLDARGSLNAATLETFHESLYREFEGDHQTVMWRGVENCGEIDGETFPNYTVKFQAQNHEGGSDLGTTSGTFSYTDGQDFDQQLNHFLNHGGLDYGQEYRVISAEVRTSSQNILLGAFGMPCQKFTSHVNAGAFNEYR